MRAFAEDTTVSIEKSRVELLELLREWKCDGVQWTDHWSEGRSMLQFMWSFEKRKYLARFIVLLPDEKTLRERSKHAQRGTIIESKLKRNRELAGRHEHRTLLYFIRSAFAAVKAKLVTPEQVFLPFLVGSDGRTVAESALPQLHRLLEGGTGAELLALPPPRPEG